jgi:hypothetical protein
MQVESNYFFNQDTVIITIDLGLLSFIYFFFSQVKIFLAFFQISHEEGDSFYLRKNRIFYG